MINKKLKSYLEYKIVHPKPLDSNQALLKLKAFQKSRQKSHQRNHSLQKSSHTHKHSQSFAETAHSTFTKSKNPQKPNLCSMNDQIRELQQKVETLLSDKNQQNTLQSIQVSRSHCVGDGYRRSKDKRYSNSKQKQKERDRRNFTESSSLMKNQRLRDSFINSLGADDYEQSQKEISYKSLIVLKMEACKLLTNLDIEPRRLDFFDKAKSPQQIFQMLQNILSISIAQMIIENTTNINQNQQQHIASLKVESQRYKLHIKHLQNQISQFRKQRSSFQETISSLKHKLQQKQTQLYQSEMLHTQTQNQLLKQSLEHRTQLQKFQSEQKIRYQKQIYQKINKLQQKQLIQTKLKQYLHNQVEDNSALEFRNNVLLAEVQKWSREAVRLRERYQQEKMEKDGIQEERNLQVSIYEEYKNVIKDGYFSLVQKLGEEICQLRQSQKLQSQQIVELKNKTKSQGERVKEYENDYLCLNQDYSRDVREWVAKQEYYQKTIKQLRSQIEQAHQTIANYSKMLATSAIKNSILDSTEND